MSKVLAMLKRASQKKVAEDLPVPVMHSDGGTGIVLGPEELQEIAQTVASGGNGLMVILPAAASGRAVHFNPVPAEALHDPQAAEALLQEWEAAHGGAAMEGPPMDGPPQEGPPGGPGVPPGQHAGPPPRHEEGDEPDIPAGEPQGAPGSESHAPPEDYEAKKSPPIPSKKDGDDEDDDDDNGDEKKPPFPPKSKPKSEGEKEQDDEDEDADEKGNKPPASSPQFGPYKQGSFAPVSHIMGAGSYYAMTKGASPLEKTASVPSGRPLGLAESIDFLVKGGGYSLDEMLTRLQKISRMDNPEALEAIRNGRKR